MVLIVLVISFSSYFTLVACDEVERVDPSLLHKNNDLMSLTGLNKTEIQLFIFFLLGFKHH